MPDRTMGKLYVGEEVFHTIERPWIPSPDHFGGKNFESCVPDGMYVLNPFDSEKHPACFSLVNENLSVFLDKDAEPGRWAILIHSGNYVTDVVGCIAPGLTADESHVWNSRKAMNRIRALVADDEEHTILIEPRGAVN
jgi:hypothetical protein